MTLAVIAVFVVLEAAARPDLAGDARVSVRCPRRSSCVMRHNLPETAVWLIRHGRFREAKQVTRARMYGDALDMLPDADIAVVTKPRPTAFLADIFGAIRSAGAPPCSAGSPASRRSTEFSTFAFYIPVLVRDGRRVRHPGHQSRHPRTLCHCRDLGLGWSADHAEDRPAWPQHRGIRDRARLTAGRGGFALYTGHVQILLPFAAAAMLWGHYWDAENCHDHPDDGRAPGISRHRKRASPTCSSSCRAFLCDLFVSRCCLPRSASANATLFVALFPH